MKLFLPSSIRRLVLSLVALSCVQLALGASPDNAQIRLKNLVRIRGVERIDLIGYGVVVGLRGTGDKDIDLAKRTLSNLMKNFNVFIEADDITSKNVAVVMVTAAVDPFHRKGDRIDLQVSSIGDAGSLQGGILLMTPLQAPDGRVYALAQGALSVGGYSVGQGGAGGETEVKNFPTVGRVLSGGVVKYDHEIDFISQGQLDLVLRNPDFTTAQRIADAVNAVYPAGAQAEDAGTVSVRIPSRLLDAGMGSQFVSSIESLRVVPDMEARVVVNERTGTVVMGGEVSISTAIIAHGNLTVRVGSTLSTSQPQPFSRTGDTVVTENIETSVSDEPARILVVPQATATVQELADVLNQLGASPSDLISILDALRELGALQMDMITM